MKLDILPSYLETRTYKQGVVGSSPTPPTSHPATQQNQQLTAQEIPATSAGALKPPSNLEYITTALEGLSPQQVDALNQYLIGSLSAIVNPQQWAGAIDLAKIYATKRAVS